MKCSALILIVLSCATGPGFAADRPDESTVYDSNPQHLWNRLNETLFDRTAPDGKKIGLNELDILYWVSTKNLLAGPSHQQALAVLDEFINARGENLIRDPLKRALLQRDIWELFDWSAKGFRPADEGPACRELQTRLALVIRRLALTTNEIATLPDNYADSVKKDLADLPAGLLQTNGDWVSVGPAYSNEQPVAPTHVAQFDGHSAFSVMVHVPGGRLAALNYLDRLRLFKQQERLWVYQTNRFSWMSTNEPSEVLELNPGLPHFEPNTEWALVRRMCVIDNNGHLQPTPITESLQLRRYLRTDRGIPDQRFSTNDVQQFFEFQMDKRQKAALRAIGPDEEGFAFVHFMGKGIDMFEGRIGASTQKPAHSASSQTKLVRNCYQCHSARGLFSVLSYTGFTSPAVTDGPANLHPVDYATAATATIYWKQQRYDWGLMQGLWMQNQ